MSKNYKISNKAYKYNISMQINFFKKKSVTEVFTLL